VPRTHRTIRLDMPAICGAYQPTITVTLDDDLVTCGSCLRAMKRARDLLGADYDMTLPALKPSSSGVES
jgi:hypothetical protein